jgi:Uncharacterized protein with conserved CXXC pairs
MNVQINENGNISMLYLCSECAAKRGLAFLAPFSLGDVFPHAIRSDHDELRCKTCGMTLSQFKKVGVVGCQNCYHDLRTGTEPILRQVQKGMRHVGRTPIGHSAAKLPSHSTAEKQDDQLVELNRLQAEMNQAVAKEDFENAAVLRDQIRTMELKARGAKQGGDKHDAE